MTSVHRNPLTLQFTSQKILTNNHLPSAPFDVSQCCFIAAGQMMDTADWIVSIVMIMIAGMQLQ